MNLGEATVVLRPRRALQLVDLCIAFVRRLAPKTYLTLGVLVLVPPWLGCLGLRTQDAEWPLIWCIAISVARITELPFCILAGRLLFDTTATTGQILSASIRALPIYLATSVIYGLLLLGSAVLVVGPLFVASNFFFLSEIVALEKAGFRSAFTRSKRFLQNQSSTGIEGVFFTACLSFAFVSLAEFLGQALFEVVLDVHEPLDSLFQDGGSIFALFGFFLSIPYTTAFRFLAYTNERTKRDGWDIQVTFLRIRGEKSQVSTVETTDAA